MPINLKLFSIKNARRSISRVLSPPFGDRWPFIWDVRYRTPHATYPDSGTKTYLPKFGIPSLFGLAPGGVYPAIFVTENAVRSYHTLSPLPLELNSNGGLLSVALSLRSPSPAVNRHRVSMEPGLSSPRGFPLCERRPSDRLAYYKIIL